MRKIYITYILAALCTAWVVLFYLGFSAGFANYIPIAALLGAVVLLVIATPLIIYFQRPGLLVGLIGCMLMLPYSLIFIWHLFSENRGMWNWTMVLIIIPSVLVLLNTYFTVKSLFVNKGMVSPVAVNSVSKVLLAAVPVLIFLLYLAFYGRYWSLD